MPVGNTRHALGVDENVLLSGKSCSWRGSVLEITNGSILECAEVLGYGVLAIMRKRSFLNRRRGPGGKLVEFDPEVVEVAVG